jgi:intein/homing endonuclease
MAVEDIIIGRDPEDLEKYGKRGCINLGRHIVGKGYDFHLTNPVLMDVIRPHVVLILGKRGSGKCLEGNTLIPTDDGSLVPIKDLVNDSRKIFAVNNKLKVDISDKEEFFVREVERLIHLRLRSGREIKLTPEHPLLTVKGWKPVNHLSIGSRIATPRKIEAFGHRNLEDYKIKLLAYLLAEGHLSNGFVLFSNSDKTLYADFYNSVIKFDPSLKIDTHSKEGCYRISKCRREVDKSKMRLCINEKGQFSKGTYAPQKKSTIREWLESLKIYGKLSKEKFIPHIVFQLPKEQLSVFLNRLFSCDGSIYKHKTAHGYVWEISYSSSSNQMIHQIQHLLLRFGVMSRIRNKKTTLNGKNFDSYEIVIGTDNIERFIKEIGFFSEKKTRRQEICLREIEKIRRNPNVDTIPKEVWDIFRPENWAVVGRYFGYKNPKALRSSINYGPSRQKLLQISEATINEYLKLLATSDIFWDEIVSMEMLEGNFKVYDISVPAFHNFVANDIIVHNSYTGGVIAEEITSLPEEIKQNLACLMIDTMGIFWSMKNPNDQDVLLLNEWGLKPKSFPVRNIVPVGLTDFYDKAGIGYDGTFSVKPSELSVGDWALTFDIDILEPLGILLERVLRKLVGREYSIRDIINEIEADKRSEDKEKLALENRFIAAEGWGIFSTEATPIEEFLKPGAATVLDVSLQEWSIRNLMLGILVREIYQARMSARREEELAIMEGEFVKKIPMTWIIIDEAENFIPARKETAATRDILTLLRQGRQPGISLVLITQRPNRIHEDSIAQADLVISHRLTAKLDLEALSAIMQTYLLFDIKKSITELPKTKGSALVLDDNSERLFNIQVRPRMSWHAGGSPVALKEKT